MITNLDHLIKYLPFIKRLTLTVINTFKIVRYLQVNLAECNQGGLIIRIEKMASRSALETEGSDEPGVASVSVGSGSNSDEGGSGGGGGGGN